ncbi:hypothetical protein Tco_0961214 [Tanacetum coccineum]
MVPIMRKWTEVFIGDYLESIEGKFTKPLKPQTLVEPLHIQEAISQCTAMHVEINGIMQISAEDHQQQCLKEDLHAKE